MHLGWDRSPVLQSSDWAYVLENADLLLAGTIETITLTMFAIVLGFLAGFPAGAIEVYGSAWIRKPVWAVGVVLRSTPILVILVFLFFVAPFATSAFVAAVIGLGFRSAAYQAQLFRGSLQSVESGQMEAARSVGMTRYQAIRHVIVPQALRRSIPGFQNEFTIVLKDTSIAIILGISELLGVTEDLFLQSGRSGAALELMLTASLIYFVLTVSTNRSIEYLGDVYEIPSGEKA